MMSYPNYYCLSVWVIRVLTTVKKSYLDKDRWSCCSSRITLPTPILSLWQHVKWRLVYKCTTWQHEIVKQAEGVWSIIGKKLTWNRIVIHSSAVPWLSCCLWWSLSMVLDMCGLICHWLFKQYIKHETTEWCNLAALIHIKEVFS